MTSVTRLLLLTLVPHLGAELVSDNKKWPDIKSYQIDNGVCVEASSGGRGDVVYNLRNLVRNDIACVDVRSHTVCYYVSDDGLIESGSTFYNNVNIYDFYEIITGGILGQCTLPNNKQDLCGLGVAWSFTNTKKVWSFLISGADSSDLRGVRDYYSPEGDLTGCIDGSEMDCYPKIRGIENLNAARLNRYYDMKVDTTGLPSNVIRSSLNLPPREMVVDIFDVIFDPTNCPRDFLRNRNILFPNQLERTDQHADAILGTVGYAKYSDQSIKDMNDVMIKVNNGWIYVYESELVFSSTMEHNLIIPGKSAEFWAPFEYTGRGTTYWFLGPEFTFGKYKVSINQDGHLEVTEVIEATSGTGTTVTNSLTIEGVISYLNTQEGIDLLNLLVIHPSVTSTERPLLTRSTAIVGKTTMNQEGETDELKEVPFLAEFVLGPRWIATIISSLLLGVAALIGVIIIGCKLKRIGDIQLR